MSDRAFLLLGFQYKDVIPQLFGKRDSDENTVPLVTEIREDILDCGSPHELFLFVEKLGEKLKQKYQHAWSSACTVLQNADKAA